ncbi:MAG: radical SAM protein [Kiritimatiellae bacterium]|nr:radical SAM protein [Kiritimatiellia bacterium]
MTATIFEVREFCLHDGPGIRTTVFFKGCPLRCAWCHNPEGLSPEPEMLFKAAKCQNCGNCRRGGDCPHGARVPCGRRWTVAELVQEIRVNADILRSSGGGVTFSGGEPLMQAKFLCALADELRSGETPLLPGGTTLPLNLALETSGYAPEAVYREVVEQMDLVFQDLKHPDPAEHKRWTGVDPTPIHANLAWLKASGRPFVARIPLIPGVNDSDAAKEGFARLLKGPSGLLRVELLPYHLTAAAKYPFTGRVYDPGFDPTAPLNKETAAFERHGLPVVVM